MVKLVTFILVELVNLILTLTFLYILILADEPTGSLNSVNKEVVFKILKKMQAQGKTIVIVSHDEELVERADRIINI